MACLALLAMAPSAVAQQAAPAPPVVAVIGLADAAQMLPPETRAAGIDLSRIVVPDAAGLAARLAPLLGARLDMEMVDRLRSAVTDHYRAAGRPFVDIGLPEQDVTEGVVHIVITEFRIGTVRVEGNAWFRDGMIRGGAGLVPGEVVDKTRLDRRIAQLGSGAFLSVTPEFRPGEAPGTTDVVLRVTDRMPLDFSLGVNNSGSPSTGWERIVLGATWGDVFGTGQTLNWQFTTSPDFWRQREQFNGREREPAAVGHTIGWQAPLPWGHTLGLSAGLMRQSPRLGPDLGSRGRTTLLGATYAVPLGEPGFGLAPGASHEIGLGYDFKRSNNDLSFGGDTVQRGFSEVSQFTLRYTLQLPDSAGLTQLQNSLVLSPGGMTPNNTDAAFQPSGLDRSGTPGAQARYAYDRLVLTRMTPLPAGFGLLLRATGQIASGTLLPSEQLPLAGIESVRGYQEFGVAGSDGVVLAAELRLPRVSPAGLLVDAATDGLQPHLFVDWGRGWNRTPSDAAPARNRAASIGVGARYEVGRHLSLRLEQGWQLVDAPRQSADGAFLHFAATATW
jgi:hemolysin activation/secretion protein